jgi:GT2 family glycosyltransferase
MPAVAAVVSVVAPTHHRVASLRLMLASLEAQTLAANTFEVIVVGDENDPGAEVVAEFSQHGSLNVRFTSVPDDPWHGRSPALKRNFGAELAQAEWIAFIDDDCVADPHWLEAAVPYFSNPRLGGVEGRKVIPETRPPTLTYRGLLRFTLPGGYQTANMFYRRAVFAEVGGFDTGFPFYLEDTDLAWSVLDRGYEIPHAADAVVEHPIPPAEPMRLLASAQRGILMPYLYKKHPERFKASRTRTIAKRHVPYLFGYIVALAATLSQHWVVALLAIGLVLSMSVAHGFKLFWGCRFTWTELCVTTALLPVVPVVTLFQLIRGNVRYRTLLLR